VQLQVQELQLQQLVQELVQVPLPQYLTHPQ
jgi:hypothetical protein